MDVRRGFWLDRIEKSWKTRPLVWLSGVRRIGKTTLARGLPEAAYFNCDLPRVQRELEDPEVFFRELKAGRIILDEIHRLPDPARVLKIAVDEFGKRFRILATGSSTLAATRKFSDSLTDRKRDIHLVPVLPEEMAGFRGADLRRRLLFGGLPPALLAGGADMEFYSEWRDSFYARDVQEMFKIEKRQPFLDVLEWLLRSNGQMIELTELAKIAGISRPTAVRYVEALEITQAITVVRPFHGGSAQELVKQPKVYGFDTGFVCHARGWGELRPEDAGALLENLVLESLQASQPGRKIQYWRTKQREEIDFVVSESKAGSRNEHHAIECKWKMAEFSDASLRSFREAYPKGRNWVVCSDAVRPQKRVTRGGLEVLYLSIQDFRGALDTEDT